MEDQLPIPGMRFYPTEEELVSFYLHNKLEGRRQDIDRVIPVLDIYEYNPKDLQQFAGERCRGDSEQWFFFIPMQEREARGGRPNRLTTEGYWKATGSPGYVYSSNNRVIGGKRTMVFYEGRAPNGKKTQWKMNEYRAIEGEASSSTTTTPPKLRQEFSLCRVYIRSKSLRAFDRRPTGVISNEATAHQPFHANEASTSGHQNHPVAERTSSRGSSSSAEGSNLSQAIESGDWNFGDARELSWDWDFGIL